MLLKDNSKPLIFSGLLAGHLQYYLHDPCLLRVSKVDSNGWTNSVVRKESNMLWTILCDSLNFVAVGIYRW